MSNEPTPPKKLPLRRRFLPTTLAGKVSATTALALVAILVVVWLLRLFGPQSVTLAHAVSLPHRIIELLLVVLIPFVLYWGIRRWNQVIQGDFPDIDLAWEAGIRALQAKGVAATDYPIFLVLGSSGDDAEQGLMEALETKLTVHGVPDAAGVSHALQWYMSSDAIYLFCPGASSLSVLMGRWSPASMSVGNRRISRASTHPSLPAGSAASGPPRSDSTALPKIERSGTATPSGNPANATVTAQPTGNPTTPFTANPDSTALKKESAMRASAESKLKNAAQPPAYLGTIQHHAVDPTPQSGGLRESAAALKPMRGSAFDMPSPAPPFASSPLTRPASGEALRPAPRYEGTISLDQYSAAQESKRTSATDPHSPVAKSAAAVLARPSGLASAMPRSTAGKKIALPANLDTSDQIPRLRYVCKLLRRARRPMCGINGTVTLIPFELSRVGPLQLSAIAQSARSDLETIQQTLGIRTPVTAVLVGMEQDKGFTELVRRLQSGLLSRRLGGRFDLRSRPTPEELNTHSDRLCDAFEDWVYRLFSREDGLAQQRGNRKLYALTCKIRHELKPRLRIVLGQAFGCESSEQSVSTDDDDSFFFSGCYFAASGATTGQAAFVKGVLKDKLMDEQSMVQWTKEARRTQAYLKLGSLMGWMLVVVFFVWFVMSRVMASGV